MFSPTRLLPSIFLLWSTTLVFVSSHGLRQARQFPAAVYWGTKAALAPSYPSEVIPATLSSFGQPSEPLAKPLPKSSKVDKDDKGGKVSASTAEGPEKSHVLRVKDRWLSLAYWWPMICGAGVLLVMTEVAYPVLDKAMKPTLILECLLFAATMFLFGGIVMFTWDEHAAGHKQLIAMAAMMCSFAFLVLLYTASFFMQRQKGHEHDPTRTLALDIALQFRQVARVAVLFLIANVIIHELDIDTGSFVMLLAFVLLGVALATAGVITDIISHIFIRLDEHFYEGDILMIKGPGTEVQIEKMGWRHTIAMGLATRAQVTIPNRKLSIGDTIVNLSRDKGRKIEYCIPLAGGLPAEALETIVKEAWAVVQAGAQDDFTFTSPSGKTYDSQILAAKCLVFIGNMADCSGGGEFTNFQLKLVLEGRYFYSKPPPWSGEPGAEPEKGKRQNDWKAGWFAHVEWILFGVRKVVEKHQSKSQVTVKSS